MLSTMWFYFHYFFVWKVIYIYINISLDIIIYFILVYNINFYRRIVIFVIKISKIFVIFIWNLVLKTFFKFLLFIIWVYFESNYSKCIIKGLGFKSGYTIRCITSESFNFLDQLWLTISRIPFIFPNLFFGSLHNNSSLINFLLNNCLSSTEILI